MATDRLQKTQWLRIHHVPRDADQLSQVEVLDLLQEVLQGGLAANRRVAGLRSGEALDEHGVQGHLQGLVVQLEGIGGELGTQHLVVIAKPCPVGGAQASRLATEVFLVHICCQVLPQCLPLVLEDVDLEAREVAEVLFQGSLDLLLGGPSRESPASRRSLC